MSFSYFIIYINDMTNQEKERGKRIDDIRFMHLCHSIIMIANGLPQTFFILS
jgi:hypothetical protein